ncbi:hypothetical protein Lfu02_18820 [Longispora fulva]|uniref:Uncharacterized protein n=1 Tax=Longispora fulva TaxID=619741 RepID=A0A8J7GWJ2_9ACTN|nr:hypothetical protein [Longispora fulva]MBG6140114.1 hypothetical protein [Longispora fulva]GIG57510.1 hypothetical protein Lfu02_18820 [Longispora fulva]
MTGETATALGTLDTHEADGLYRIIGLCLHDEFCADGDGVYAYWLVPGETYGIHHDGVTWTVAGGAWTEPGHTYRLLDDGHPATAVPMLHGDEPLDPECAYIAHHGPECWELWRLN